jgi:hypothetical protein
VQVRGGLRKWLRRRVISRDATDSLHAGLPRSMCRSARFVLAWSRSSAGLPPDVKPAAVPKLESLAPETGCLPPSVLREVRQVLIPA